MFKFPFNNVRVTMKLQHTRHSQWNNKTTGNADKSTNDKTGIRTVSSWTCDKTRLGNNFKRGECTPNAISKD